MSKHTGKTCSPEAIRRVLYNVGYHGRNVRKNRMLVRLIAKNALLLQRSIKAADESKLNINRSDGHESNEHVRYSKTRWWVYNGLGMHVSINMEFIVGIMYRHKYLDILKDNLEDSAKKMGLPTR